MRRAFVTGGSGFVGRNLIAALRAREVEVRGLARSDEAAEKVRQAGGEAILGGLDDGALLREGMGGCDVAFHAAAVVKLWGKPSEFHEVNVKGTECMLEAAREAGVPRFVYVSTDALLAGGPPVVDADETWPYPRKPVGLYALTKGIAEREVLAANTPDFTTVALRPPLIWGRGDTSVLPQIAATVKHRVFTWFDGGHYPHSTCHIDNAIEGILLAAEKGRGGEAYFLTDGAPMDYREFVTSLLKTQGLDPGEKNMPLWRAKIIARLFEVTWKALGRKRTPPLVSSVLYFMGQQVTVSDAKARAELGYKGKVAFEEGIAAMMAGDRG